ncbi:MAG: branched-chain amino acid ABC transporter permease, partial [Acidobacteria bacterium]|nr:branched-chain amino acid ABC transporter permease [Acidobacteriota bacterium]
MAVAQVPVEKFVNALGSGLALGAIYALLALGFVIIFKATQVVNFAHGGIAALGAYLVSYFATVSNIPGRWMGDISPTLQWTLSALVAVAFMALIGVVIERVTIRPMIGEPLFSVALITLGLDLIIRITTNDLMDNTTQGLGDPWGVKVVEIGFFRIAQTQIVTILVLFAVGLVLAWFFKT